MANTSNPLDMPVSTLRAIKAAGDRITAETELRLAQVALDKLRNPIIAPPPTLVEFAALEFVIRMMRPAPLSKDGELAPLPSAPVSTTYNPATERAWNGFRAAIKPYLYSMGRLDRTAGTNPEIDTCFLVGSDLPLTNHHVVSLLSHGADALQAKPRCRSIKKWCETCASISTSLLTSKPWPVWPTCCRRNRSTLRWYWTNSCRSTCPTRSCRCLTSCSTSAARGPSGKGD